MYVRHISVYNTNVANVKARFGTILAQKCHIHPKQFSCSEYSKQFKAVIVKYTKSTREPSAGELKTFTKIPSGHITQVYFSLVKQIYHLCPSNVVKR